MGIQSLHDYTEHHPNCPQSWQLYSKWLYKTGDTKNSLTAILKAYALDPHNRTICRTAAKVLAASNKQYDSLQLLEKCYVQFRECWSIWALGARINVKYPQTQINAKTLSAKATSLQPRHPQAWFQHGEVLALAGNHQEAIVAVTEGIKWLPEKPSLRYLVYTHWLLAENQVALNNKHHAKNHYSEVLFFSEKMVETDPMMGYYWQGKAHEKLQNHCGRLRSYRMAKNHHLFYPYRKEIEEVLRPDNAMS